MNAPQPAMMLPREIVHQKIVLSHKPGASIELSLALGKEHNFLVVFLNGLMTDKTSWLPVMGQIIRKHKSDPIGFSSMLAYDRYGQGLTTDRDPQDEGREHGHGHNCADAAEDLRQLIDQIAKEKFSTNAKDLNIILVANSIGCAIARLYAHAYPVAGLLFLDSVMADSDFDLWPNPDTTKIHRPENLPFEVTDDILREQRANFAAIFHPSVINNEGLSRRDLATLLPYSDSPMLRNEVDRPWIIIVGHDFETFAEESLRTMGTPKVLSMKFSNPAWESYNQGLSRLTDDDRSNGPIQAKGCGHFIQKDDPNFVVGQIMQLLDSTRYLGRCEGSL